MQNSINTNCRRKRTIVFLALLGAFIIILSSCNQPYTQIQPTVTLIGTNSLFLSTVAVTPQPTINLTPQTTFEATLFPVVGTATAQAKEFNATIQPMISTGTASALLLRPTPSQVAAQPSRVFESIWNLIIGILILGPVSLIITLVGWGKALSRGFDFRDFVYFILSPRVCAQRFHDPDQQVNVDNIFLRRIYHSIEKLRTARSLLDENFIANFASTALVLWLEFVFIFWGSRSHFRQIVFELMAQGQNSTPVLIATAAIYYLLILGVILLINVFDTIGFLLGKAWNEVYRRQSMAEGTFDRLLRAVATTWGLFLIPLFIAMIFHKILSLSILVQSTGFFILSGLLLVLMGRMLTSQIWEPILLIPKVIIEYIWMKVRQFSESSYQHELDTPIQFPSAGVKFSFLFAAILIFNGVFIGSLDFFSTVFQFNGTFLDTSIKSMRWFSILHGAKAYFPLLDTISNISIRTHFIIMNPLPGGKEFFVTLPSFINTSGFLVGSLLIILFYFAGWLSWATYAAVLVSRFGFRGMNANTQASTAGRIIFTNSCALILWRSILASVLHTSNLDNAILVIDVSLLCVGAFYALGYVTLAMRKLLALKLGWKWVVFPLALIYVLVIRPVCRLLMATLEVLVYVSLILGMISGSVPYFLQLVIPSASAYLPPLLRLVPLISTIEAQWINNPILFGLYSFLRVAFRLPGSVFAIVTLIWLAVNSAEKYKDSEPFENESKSVRILLFVLVYLLIICFFVSSWYAWGIFSSLTNGILSAWDLSLSVYWGHATGFVLALLAGAALLKVFFPWFDLLSWMRSFQVEFAVFWFLATNLFDSMYKLLRMLFAERTFTKNIQNTLRKLSKIGLSVWHVLYERTTKISSENLPSVRSTLSYLFLSHSKDVKFKLSVPKNWTSGSEMSSSINVYFPAQKELGLGLSFVQTVTYFLVDLLISLTLWPWLPDLLRIDFARFDTLTTSFIWRDNAIYSLPLTVLSHFVVLLLVTIICFVLYAATLVYLLPPRRLVERFMSNMLETASRFVLSLSITHIGYSLFFVVAIYSIDTFRKNHVSDIGMSISALNSLYLIANLVGFALFALMEMRAANSALPVWASIFRHGEKKLELRKYWVNSIDLFRSFFSSSGIRKNSLSSGAAYFVILLNGISLLMGSLVLFSAGVFNHWNIDWKSVQEFLGYWATGLIISCLLAPVASLLSLPLLYQLSFRVLNRVQSFFGILGQYAERNKRKQLASLYAACRKPFYSNHTLYGGYRDLLQAATLSFALSYGMVGIFSKLWLSGLLLTEKNPAVFFILEMMFTCLLASLITSNVSRAIPVVIFAGSFGDFLLLNSLILQGDTNLLIYISLPVLLFLIYLVFSYIIERRRTASSSGLLNQIIQRLESKWRILEVFSQQLDDSLFHAKAKPEVFAERLIFAAAAAEEYGYQKDIFFGKYEEDPGVNAILFYRYASVDRASALIQGIAFNPYVVLGANYENIPSLIWLRQIALELNGPLSDMSEGRLMDPSKSLQERLDLFFTFRKLRMLNSVEAGILQSTITISEPILPERLLRDDKYYSSSSPHSDDELNQALLGAFAVYKQEHNIGEIYNEWLDLETIISSFDLSPQESIHETVTIYRFLDHAAKVQSTSEIGALSVYEEQINGVDLAFLGDVAGTLVELWQIADSISRSEELNMPDRVPYYASGISRLARITNLAREEICEPERAFVMNIAEQWSSLLTERLSSIAPARAQIEIYIQNQELYWEDEEIISVVILNSGEGAAYDLKLNGSAVTSCEILEPRIGFKLPTIAGNAQVNSEFRIKFFDLTKAEVSFVVTYADAERSDNSVSGNFTLRRIALDADPFRKDISEAPNPYLYGPAIDKPHQFFGRADVMQEIDSIFNDPDEVHVFMIYGQRRMGKTSVLKQILHKAQDKKRFWPIFISMEKFSSRGVDGLIWEIARTIWYTLPKGHDVPVPNREEFRSSPGTAFTNQFIPSVLDYMDRSTGYTNTLLLLFDEFDVIYDNAKKYSPEDVSDFLHIIRNVTQEIERGGLIYVGTYKLMEMVSAHSDAPLFNLAQRINISYFDYPSAEELIVRPVSGILNYDSAVKAKLHRLSGDHPYYLQLLCFTLFSYCKRTKTPYVGLSVLNQVLREAQEQESAIGYLWEELTKLEKYVVASLARIANYDTDSVAAITILRELSGLGIRPTLAQVQNSVAQLKNIEVLRVVGDQFQFRVDLFRRWLRDNKPLPLVRAELGPLSDSSETDNLEDKL